MLFAQSKAYFNSIPVYVSLLNELIEQANDKNKLLFEHIIDQTIRLANKQISHFDIDSKIYPIVAYLIDNFSEDFEDLSDTSEKDKYQILRDRLLQEA
ncbi:hypothetical protein ACS5NO_31630 [Larkinella sp. GY13]|uniref:hypothetical protein n=1 Tax=Larkinella sp. GY13 TaxID=3453720 RepID=UPI003EED9F7D